MQRFEMIQTLLGQMLGQIDDIIMLADDQRHITYMNDSAVKAFGYPREALDRQADTCAVCLKR